MIGNQTLAAFMFLHSLSSASSISIYKKKEKENKEINYSKLNSSYVSFDAEHQ